MNISIHSGENDPQWLILWECVILPPPVRPFNVCQTFGSSGDPPVDFRKRLLQKGRFGNPMFVSGAGHFMTDDFSGKCMDKNGAQVPDPWKSLLVAADRFSSWGSSLGTNSMKISPKSKLMRSHASTLLPLVCHEIFLPQASTEPTSGLRCCSLFHPYRCPKYQPTWALHFKESRKSLQPPISLTGGWSHFTLAVLNMRISANPTWQHMTSLKLFTKQMALSENVGLIFPMRSPFNNGIMISKTIGFRGTNHFQTHPDVEFKSPRFPKFPPFLSPHFWASARHVRLRVLRGSSSAEVGTGSRCGGPSSVAVSRCTKIYITT